MVTGKFLPLIVLKINRLKEYISKMPAIIIPLQ